MSASDAHARRPSRPAVSAAFWALAVTLAGERLVLQAGRQMQRETLVSLICVSAVLLVAIAAFAWRQVREGCPALVPIVALSLVAALISAMLCCLRQARLLEELSHSAVSSWEVEVVSDVSSGSFGYRSRAVVAAGDDIAGEVWLLAPEPLERLTVLSCVGRFRPPAGSSYDVSSWAQGVCGSVTVVRVVSQDRVGGVRGCAEGIRRWALERLRPSASPGRALLAGCVCGYRSAMDEQGLTDDFSACGVAHLIAVSGAHIAIVSALAAKALETLQVGVKARVVALLCVTGAYVVLCGAPASAVRAWAMATVAHGSQLAGRRAHALSSVSLVGLIMALADPTLSGQLGFLLSVVSVVGLCVFGSYATYALETLLPCPTLPVQMSYGARRSMRGLWRNACEGVAATFVCQLVTLPLVAPVFGSISLLAPVANLVLSPLLCVLVCLGVVALCFAWTPVGTLLLWACDAVSCAMVGVAGHLAALPVTSASLAATGTLGLALALVALVVLLLWWPQVSRRALGRVVGVSAALLFVWVVRWRLFAPARIVVLDVGQGDAILVQDGAASLLVDTGPDSSVVDALARMHVFHIDAVLITHLHDDHYGGLDDLAGHVACDEVIVAEGVAKGACEVLGEGMARLTASSVREVSYGDTLRVGGFLLRVISPVGAVDGTENAHSLELLVEYEGGSAELTALLTGDAEHDQTSACIARGDVGDIDLLKVGHHGSEVSLDASDAQALSAEVAVASAGEGNEYGHPRQECIEMLEQSGSLFLCTKDVGDVDIRPGARGPIICCSGDQLLKGLGSGGGTKSFKQLVPTLVVDTEFWKRLR